MRNNGDAEFWSIPFRRCKYSAGHAYFTICILPVVTDTAPTALALLHHVRDPSLQWTRRVCIWNTFEHIGHRTQTYTNLYVKYPVPCSSVTNVCPSLQKTHTHHHRYVTSTTQIYTHTSTALRSNVDSHTHKLMELYEKHVGQQQTIRIPPQQNQPHLCYTNIGAACK
jgi:hypothetical protein